MARRWSSLRRAAAFSKPPSERDAASTHALSCHSNAPASACGSSKTSRGGTSADAKLMSPPSPLSEPVASSMSPTAGDAVASDPGDMADESPYSFGEASSCAHKPFILSRAAWSNAPPARQVGCSQSLRSMSRACARKMHLRRETPQRNSKTHLRYVELSSAPPSAKRSSGRCCCFTQARKAWKASVGAIPRHSPLSSAIDGRPELAGGSMRSRSSGSTGPVSATAPPSTGSSTHSAAGSSPTNSGKSAM
mmetsp:Transcript_110876/g.320461  ORF Transcript_110876/g.320461 Transcript_110876/m.320461 type:complete len:250 (-) Transcript_110876:331-1080(-)